LCSIEYTRFQFCRHNLCPSYHLPCDLYGEICNSLVA
jgi:hypothetical protein